MVRAFASLAAVSAAGCIVSVNTDGQTFLCAEEPRECPPGLVCDGQRCVEPGADAGAADAGATQFRRALTVDSALAVTAVQTPVVVILDSTRVNYDAAGAGGASLRFFDADDNPIDHQVAAWNPAGQSTVWLRPQTLSAGAMITMSYGGAPGASSDVWTDHALVVDFENELDDASPSNLELDFEGGAELSPGLVGGGATFDGSDDFINIGTDLSTFNSRPGATLSLWLNTTSITTAAVLEFANAAGSSSRVFLGLVDQTSPRFGILTSDIGGETEQITGAPISTGQWHWLLGTADLEDRTITLYVDGVQAAEAALTIAAEEFPATNSTAATAARNDTSSAGFYAGVLDELRAVPRSVDAGWVAAQYLSMTDALFVFGPEEPL